MLSFLEAIGRYTAFAGRALVVTPLAVTRPREALRQFHAVLIGALPLAVVAGLAIGIVLWMHLRGVLARFGGSEAVQYLPTAVALAVTLEFAPIGAGLILAGRSGASLGAELGSMRLTEQIDALEMLGLSPLRELVGPRVLACMIALPLLTIFVAFTELGAGFLAELVAGSLTWTQYQTEILRPLRLRDVVPSLLKTVAFGFLVGVTGCHAGLEAEGGTEGVGRAATRGVVLSILL